MFRAVTRLLRARLRKSEVLRELYTDFDLLRKYGKLRPERVSISGSSNILFADPTERRGRALLRIDCRGQPELKKIWTTSIKVLVPDLVLDVGVNYGEFLFLPNFAPQTRVIGLEAMPSLGPFLQRSHQAHPSRECIELVMAAAGDTHGGELNFFVDDDWSGRSSVVAKTNLVRPRKLSVPVVSIDGLLDERRLRPATLVFKLDVESYEPEVLAGMTRTLEEATAVIGLVEFDIDQLTSRDKPPETFLALLCEKFDVYALQPQKKPVRIKVLRDLVDPGGHTDLILTSRGLGPKVGLK